MASVAVRTEHEVAGHLLARQPQDPLVPHSGGGTRLDFAVHPRQLAAEARGERCGIGNVGDRLIELGIGPRSHGRYAYYQRQADGRSNDTPLDQRSSAPTQKLLRHSNSLPVVNAPLQAYVDRPAVPLRRWVGLLVTA